MLFRDLFLGNKFIVIGELNSKETFVLIKLHHSVVAFETAKNVSSLEIEEIHSENAVVEFNGKLMLIEEDCEVIKLR